MMTFNYKPETEIWNKNNDMRFSTGILVNMGEPVTRHSSAVKHDPIHKVNQPLPPCSVGCILFAHTKLSQVLIDHLFQLLFGLPLQLGPLNLGYFVQVFVQSLSGFRCTCSNRLNLFLCSTVLRVTR